MLATQAATAPPVMHAMHATWTELGRVAAVAAIATVAMAVLTVFGVINLSRQALRHQEGRSGTAPFTGAVICFGLGAAVLGTGIYLIVAS
jgi:hypothetical protein